MTSWLRGEVQSFLLWGGLQETTYIFLPSYSSHLRRAPSLTVTACPSVTTQTQARHMVHQGSLLHSYPASGSICPFRVRLASSKHRPKDDQAATCHLLKEGAEGSGSRLLHFQSSDLSNHSGFPQRRGSQVASGFLFPNIPILPQPGKFPA